MVVVDAGVIEPPRPLPPHLRGRFPPPIDAGPITIWGESVASYGGGYYIDDGEKLVMLFTDDPESHRAELSRLMSAPERLVLRRTNRSQADVDKGNDAVLRVLMTGGTPHPNVISIGPTLDGDEWIIEVGILPYSEQTAAEIRELVAPEQVVVTQGMIATEF